MIQKDKKIPCTLVIFGATGDLTHRKLIPALYFLEYQNHLPKDFNIVCVARRNKSPEEYRKEAKKSIKEFSRIKIDEKILNSVLKKIHYQKLEFGNLYDYLGLIDFLKSINGMDFKCGLIFYLATAPKFFKTIINNLASSQLSGKNKKFNANKVAFEKPFGKNLWTAKLLNNNIRKVFHENQIYRIDHYLAKELVQNLLVMHFGNSTFEPLWNTEFIDHVQITVAETLGIEGRGEYYDKNGSLRDVVQNHIMQLLCLTAMECPESLSAEHIRDEKVKVLKTIMKSNNPLKDSMKGQYVSGIQDGKKVKSYLGEEGVRKNSKTSTYFAIKFCINNKKWKNVPFYVRTGKHLADRATEIVIEYKKPKNKLFKNHGYDLKNNQLIIRVQPDEGIIFKFNAKIPGNKILIDQVSMDFCHGCKFGPNTAEAYERLFHDILNSDQTLFARWDEVEYSWKIIDQIRDAWHDVKPYSYKPGTWGPKEADKFIKKDGRSWNVPKKPSYSVLLD
ncbi:glucose-6-phosphate dehydrogenase [Candidatus Woesearchaeota archaeon]|nr:glucose-6-phosphate dehydrogenase [Candidatus Woesearchaeota archaeon]